MELVAYLRLFRKWLWLLALGAFLAGGAAFLRASRLPDIYQASVTVQVGSAMEQPNPQYGDLITGENLARTYVHLAKSYDVLSAAVQASNLAISPDALGGSLRASVVEGTSLMVLTVTSTDPVLAADMANAVAEQLVRNNPSNLTVQQQEQIDLARGEIAKLNQELSTARVELTSIDNRLANLTDEDEIRALRERRDTVVAQINQASQNIASYSNMISNLQQRTNVLTIIERARIPTRAIGANLFSQALLGAMVGAALAGGLALLIEYLDDTISGPTEATQLLGVPTLAAITRFGKPRDGYQQRLITYRDPGSPSAEEYRTLRTNLLFSSNGSTPAKRAHVITSPGPSEGKSVTVANLAVTMAMAGWRVLLIDADLRRPRMHEAFNLKNDVGLSTLLSISPDDLNPATPDGSRLLRSIQDCVQETDIPGLRVITSGHIPLNPTEVLGSASMQRWFQEFRARDDIDIILFDSPPALVVADSAVLASAIDVPVLLVVEARGTRRGAAALVREQFEQLSIKISGVVLNAVSPRDRGTYGYGYNYYYYYYSDSSAKSAG